MDRSTKGSLAENSYAEYDSVVRHLVTPQMGEVQMDQLSTAFIDFRREQVMEEQSRSAAVRLKKVLQLICSHAVRRAALTVNPVREVQRLPGGDRRTSALSAEQWHGVVQLLRAWRQDQRGGTKPDTKKLEDILTIIIGTSLRIGEVLALRRSDMDVMSQHPQLHVCGTVVITKTKGTHRQPVPKHSEQNRRIALTTTAQSVARYRLALTGAEADALLFPSKTGNPSTVSGIERLMRAFRAENAEALTGLGIDVGEFTTHLFRRTAATFVERAGGLALFATPAAAAIASVPVAIGPDGGILAMADALGDSLTYVFDGSLLRRWGNATATLHNSGSFDIGTMLTSLSRSTGTSWMMQGAATCWLLLQGLYDFALAFDPINGFGAGLDQFVAGLAKLVLGPVGLIAVIFVLIGAIAAHVRSSRMGNAAGWRRFIGVVIMFTVIGIAGGHSTAMPGIGAAASTGSGDDYKPGLFSPGWAITSTNAGINKLSTTLAEVVNSDFVNNAVPIEWQGGGTPAAGGTMTCQQYVNAIKLIGSNAVDAQADGDSATDQSTTQLRKDRAQLNYLLSDLWQQSGLESYKTVQYGSNMYADKTFCRLLEENAGTTPLQQLHLMNISKGVAETGQAQFSGTIKTPSSGEVSKMNTLSYDNQKNRMAGMTAWAACTTDNWGETWTVDPTWAKEYRQDGEDGKVIKDPDCEQWWNGTAPGATGGADPGNIPDIFDVDGHPDGIAKAVPGDSADAQAIRDYLLTLNGGWTGGGGSGSALVYLLGSVATVISLGIVCLGTIIAKLLGIFYVLALMLMLMAGLFMRSGWSKVKQTTFQMIGSQIFAAGAVLILTFIVIFTNLLMAVGATLFERGSIWALAWMGLAPVMALVGFNLIFKKIFRLPSPMSIKGGQLFANAAAAGGGGLAGSMLGSMGRGDGDPVENGGRRLTRAAKEQLQKFGTPQDPNKREGAMGGGKRRTKLANAAAGDAAGAGAVAGGAAAAGAAVGAAAAGAGAGVGGESVAVPLGAPAAQGTVAEQVAALRHAKADGRGGLAGATVLPAVAGAGLLRRGVGAAGRKALSSHRGIRDGGGYRAAAGTALARGKVGTLEAAKNVAPQWRQARNAQGQMVLKRTTGVGAALDRAREQRFQSLAASRGINLATATRSQLQELRNDSTPSRMATAAAKARGTKAIADSKAAIKAAPVQMKAAVQAAPGKIAAGAVKAYNNPKTMSRVKTAAKVGAGASAIGLTGGLAAAPIAAFATHKAIGKSRGYFAGTRIGEHQADRLQAYRDAHAQEAARKASIEADRAARDQAAEKAQASEERIAESVATKFAAAQKQDTDGKSKEAASGEQSPGGSNQQDEADAGRE